jgi:O-antigen ligase
MDKSIKSISKVAFASAMAIATIIVLSTPALFRHTALLILVPLIPLILVFLVAPASRTAMRESISVLRDFTWWQGLWLLLFLSSLVFRTRASQDIDQSALDIWAVYRIGLVAIVALVLFVRLVSHRTPWVRVLVSGVVGLLTIYILLSLVSTTWSVRPMWTLYKSIEYLVDLAAISAVIAAVSSLEEYRKLINWTWTLLGLLVASAWVGAVIDPADGLLSGQNIGPLTVRLEGVMPSVDANTLGEICAILGLVAITRLFDDPQSKLYRGWYGALLGFSLVTLIFSQTRAAIAAFGLGLLLLLIFTRRYLLTLALAVSSAVAGIAILVFTNAGRTASDFVLRGQTTQSVEGLSGRLEIWQMSWDAFVRQPWTGYGGFAGSRFVILPQIPSQLMTSTAMSTYVDSLLDLGFWGPLLIFVTLAVICWYLIKASRTLDVDSGERAMATEMFVVFAVVAIRSFVSTNVITHPALAFLTIVGFVEVARRQMAAKRRTELLTNAA